MWIETSFTVLTKFVFTILFHLHHLITCLNSYYITSVYSYNDSENYSHLYLHLKVKQGKWPQFLKTSKLTGKSFNWKSSMTAKAAYITPRQKFSFLEYLFEPLWCNLLCGLGSNFWVFRNWRRVKFSSFFIHLFYLCNLYAFYILSFCSSCRDHYSEDVKKILATVIML